MTVAASFPGPPRPMPKQTMAKKAVDYGDLSKYWKKNPTAIGSYKVAVEYVMIRSMPSIKSTIKGRLRQGDIIDGEVRDEFLLLSPDLSQEKLAAGEGRWVLIDGASVPSLGIGVLLQRVVVPPEVKQAFGKAVELLLPEGLHDNHELQWRSTDRMGRPGALHSKPCGGQGRLMMLRDVPKDTDLEIRLVEVRDGKAAAESSWVETSTLDFEEDDESRSFDLMGKVRKKCTQCPCKMFCQEGGISLNVDWTSCRCVGCGCNVEAHMLEEDEIKMQEQEIEDKEREEERARRKEKEQREAHMNSALAVTKESLLAPWQKYDLPRDATVWPQLPVEIEEVVAWSDLHADMGANMDHLLAMPACPKTALILAGDVGTALKSIESSLRVLQSKFGAVFFVPGNHELWVDKADGLSSVHKFWAIMELCEQLGVYTRPAFVSRNCAICPLFSWYKDNLLEGFERSKSNIPFDIQTSWPWDLIGCGDSNDAQQHEIADFFLGLNSRRLRLAPRLEETATGAASRSSSMLHIITFSHFVPRQECYPGRLQLAGVMGCREIEEQVRECKAECHVFGHSHIAVDRHLDGVRYVQHPLGYPNDYHRKTKPMRIWADATALMQAIKKVSSMMSCISMEGSDASDVPTRRQADVMDSDSKWFVWNSTWSSAHMATARDLAGEAAKVSLKRGEDDRRKASGHKDEVLRSAALSEEAVRALESLTAQAGKAAASKANVKGTFAASEVKAPEPRPTGVEAELWDDLVEAVRLAAQSIHYCLLDQALLRSRPDEVITVTADNWHKFKNKSMMDLTQRQFEETFSKLVGNLREAEEPLAKEALPEATLVEGILKSFSDAVKCAEKRYSERPAGHWQEDNIWDTSQRLNHKGELELRKLMDWDYSKMSLSEAWSAHAEVQDMSLQLVNCDDESQELQVDICTGLTVGDLKEAIKHKVRRGPQEGFELFSANGTRLLDHMLLNSVEVETLSRGLMLSGIDLGPAKPIQVRILHAEEEEELTIEVEDTCSIRTVRQAIAEKLGEVDLSKCVVVKNAATASGLAPEEDDDCLYGREELQFVGRSLQCEGEPGSADLPGEIMVTIHIDRDMELMLETMVSFGSTIALLKDKIAAEDPTGMLSPEEFRLKIPDSPDVLDEASIVSNRMSELELCCA